ncbi:MAG TPA: peptidoglycan endopeptidase [Sphingobium sp.]|uniref:peptidoglycan endopeptidase n=1 Tax=Sphingobium sp. TaxID=1912891 RepID=UPI002ED4231C
MLTLGERICDAAIDLVGTAFRLHGRRADTGVDCVGLALLSVTGAGVVVPDPPAYRMRTGIAPMAPGWLHRAGFVEGQGRRAGDLVIVRVSALQLHLLVDAVDSVVHAHAGLGRVVRSPFPEDWTELSRWRLETPSSR